MSTEIEQRVVQMRFDNQQFESGTKTTMSTLEKLKSAMKFDNVKNTFSSVAQGFGKISDSMKKVDTEGFNGKIETVRSKFSALEVFAVTAMHRISNAVITAGKNLISAFTIQPITDGFKEYELKMNSIKTIIASTGESLPVVKKYLEELNTYSDKTIYSFSDMTENIGKFTNAGVKLETAVKAIQGVSNLAAVSGANANEASRAMYNFAQALSAGYVKLIDWKSIENANMATVEFKNQLLQAGVAAGVLRDNGDGMYQVLTENANGFKMKGAINATKDFNESLSYQWMTTDVLIGVLNKYADTNTEIGAKAMQAATEVRTFSAMMDALKESAGSGWATTWELIIGDLEEAKVVWTAVNNVVSTWINNMNKSRNDMLETWKALGGRDDLIAGLSNIFKNLGNILSAVGRAFREVFPRFTGFKLKELTEGFKNLTEKLMLSENTLDGITNIFKSFFKIIEVGISVLTLPLKFIPGILIGFKSLVDITGKLGGVFSAISYRVMDFFTSANVVEKVVGALAWAFTTAMTAISGFIDRLNIPMNFHMLMAAIPPFEKIRDAAGVAKDAVMDFVTKVIDSLQNGKWDDAKATVVDAFNSIKESATETRDSVIDKFTNIGEGISNAFSKTKVRVTDVFKTVMDSVRNFINDTDWAKVMEYLGGLIAGKFFIELAIFLKKIGNFMESLGESISSFAGIADKITGLLDGVRGCLESYQKNLKADRIQKLAVAIGILAASIYAISKVEKDKLIPVLGVMGGLFAELTASMILISKFGVLTGGALSMLSIASSMLILASAVNMLADADIAGMIVGVAALGALMGALTAFSYGIKKLNLNLTEFSWGLISFAGAILILSLAIDQLTGHKPEELALAIGGIAALCVAFAQSTKLLKNVNSNEGAIKLLAFAASILVLAKAVEMLSGLKWEQLAKGLVGVGALLVELGLFSRLVSDKAMISTATGMAILAGALALFIPTLLLFTLIDWGVIIDGIAKIGTVLGVLGVSLSKMPNHLPTIGAGLILVGGALLVISQALHHTAQLDLWDMIKSIGALGSMLAILSPILRAMSSSLVGAGSLAIAAVGLVVLAEALEKTSNVVEGGNIVATLVSLAAALGIITAAAWALMPVSGVLLTIAGGIAIMATSVAIVGAGLMLVAAGITALGVSLGGIGLSVGAVITALATALTKVIEYILSILPDVGRALVQTMEAIAAELITAAPVIMEAVATIMVSVLKAISEIVPQLAETALQVIAGVLEALANNIESIITSIVKILIGVIRGISVHLPELIDEALKLLVALFEGLFDAINRIDFESMMQAVIGAGLFSAFLLVLIAISPLIPAAMAALAKFGLLIVELIAILALIGGIAQIPGVKWLVEEGGELLASVGYAIGNFVGSIIGGFSAGATSGLAVVGSNLAGFAENAKPFFEIMSTVKTSMIDGVMTLAQAVGILSAEGIFNGIVKLITGKNPLVMLGEQLAEFAPYMKQYSDAIGGVKSDVVEKSALAAKALAEFAETVPNQGGMVAWFTGENSIVTFGEELIPFGQALSKYSQSVAGVKADVVEKSASAAKAIAEMAQELPNQGGMVSWFTGDNRLSKIAEEMIPFGKAISQYSNSVAGVSESNVQKSANAAKMIAEFIAIIPNQGGMVSWFTGDNTLSKMAKELAKFGPALSEYSNSVADVKMESVRKSVEAAEVIIDMMSTLPARSVDLEQFGDNFKDLGKAIEKYYKYVKDVEVSHVYESIDALSAIIDLLKELNGVSVDGVGAFTSVLNELGKKGVRNFTSAFEESGGDIRAAISKMFSEAQNAIDDQINNFNKSGRSFISAIAQGMKDSGALIPEAVKSRVTEAVQYCTTAASEFKACGVAMMDNVTKGIKDGKSKLTKALGDVVDACRDSISKGREKMANAGKELIDAVGRGIKTNRISMEGSINEICRECITVVNRYASQFLQAGKSLGSKFADGVGYHSVSSVQSAARTILNAATGQLGGGYWSAYNAGTNVVQGFANGIRNSSYLASNAARMVANNANNALRTTLRIHSPSRVMIENGKFFDQGFAKGILNNQGEVENSATSLAETAMKSMKNAMALIPKFLDEDFEFQPVIKPVLDMSNLENGQNGLSSMFMPVQTGQISALFNRPKSSIDVKSVAGGNTDKLLNDVINLLSDIRSKDTNIYMDGRQVSKAITSKIDNELAFNQRKRW